MKKIYRIISLMLTLLLLCTSIAGCTKKSTSSADTSSTEEKTVVTEKPAATTEDTTATTDEEQEPITLRFSWWGGDARAEATLAVIDQFEQLYPWITIEPEYGSDDGYNEKLSTQFSAETAPDIIQMGVGWMPDYVAMGGLFVDFKESDIDLSGFSPDFLENNGTFDGHVYGLPTGVAGSAIIVNKDLADQIGINLSEAYSFQDLIEMGKKVQEFDKDMYLLSADTTMLVASLVRVWSRQVTGQPFINDATMELSMTQDQIVEMLAFVKSLYDNNVIPPASYMAPYNKTMQTDTNWIAGKYVAALCYTSTIEVMAAANPSGNFEVGKLPIVEGAVNDGWYTDCPQYMCVYAGSPNKEAAVMFLDYFYNDPTAQETLGSVRSVPPTENARAICSEKGLINILTEEAVNLCLTYNGKSDAGKTTSQEVTAILEDMIDYVGFSAGTPEQAADETIKLLNNYLKTQK